MRSEGGREEREGGRRGREGGEGGREGERKSGRKMIVLL